MAKVRVKIKKNWAIFKKGDSPTIDSQIASQIILQGIAEKYSKKKEEK